LISIKSVMVKGKNQPVKGQPPKRSSAATCKPTPNSSPALHSSSKDKLQKQSLNVPSCSGCGSVITDQVKALQCDRCQSPDKWKCSECLNLPSDVYDHLVLDQACGLRWFCTECDNLVMETKRNNDHQNTEKFDNLTSLVESLLTKLSSLMERYEVTEKMLEEKCSVADAATLESRLAALDFKVSVAESRLDHMAELETRISEMEVKISSRAEANDDLEHDNGPPDEELIKVVVQEELNRKTAEEKDMENRRRNIILHRVPEKRSDDVTERRQSDLTFVKDLLDGVFNIQLEDEGVEKMFRLGRWSEDKARPLLVSFKDLNHKETVLSNLAKLKAPIEKFRGVGISPDLHPKEREEIKRMVDEAKQAHIGTESDEVENYRFIVVGKGLRRRVIKIKKKVLTVQQ